PATTPRVFITHSAFRIPYSALRILVFSLLPDPFQRRTGGVAHRVNSVADGLDKGGHRRASIGTHRPQRFGGAAAHSAGRIAQGGAQSRHRRFGLRPELPQGLDRPLPDHHVAILQLLDPLANGI
ncbi:MAG TPA: hypothetical protein VF306_16775, partial [Pirellulales bacterium]